MTHLSRATFIRAILQLQQLQQKIEYSKNINVWCGVKMSCDPWYKLYCLLVCVGKEQFTEQSFFVHRWRLKLQDKSRKTVVNLPVVRAAGLLCYSLLHSECHTNIKVWLRVTAGLRVCGLLSISTLVTPRRYSRDMNASC